MQKHDTLKENQKSIERYGSIKEWINHEWLLPYLVIGGQRSDFWHLTPQSIQIDFEAYNRKQKREAQDRWEIGAYVKTALNTSILVATLADKNTHNKMPKFPDRPFENEMEEQTAEQMSEERLKAERLRTYMFFKQLGKKH